VYVVVRCAYANDVTVREDEDSAGVTLCDVWKYVFK